MSRWGKISWLLSGLALVILFATRFILGGWLDYMFIPLGIFLLGVAVAVISDFKFYIEFLSMRTTKHGMNMGAMILVVVLILISLNYFGVRHNKTWDFTEEKLNSLSQQSSDVLANLSNDLKIMAFYRGDKDTEAKNQAKSTFALYQETSAKVKVRFVNAYVENVLAQKYLAGLSDANQMVVFAEYGERKVRVEYPFTEEKVTSALIKATRKSKKKVYFLTGHGERGLNSDEPEGIKGFKTALEDASFQIGSLNLLETGKMPKDADVIAIVGPHTQLQEGELQILREYAHKGGKLFIAADPGLKHQLALLTKSLGVEFKNNYIINDRIQLMGRGAAGALGMVFDGASEITKKFRSRENFTLFDVASEVIEAPDAVEGLSFLEIVRTPPTSFSVNDLKDANNPPEDRRFFTIGIQVSGSFDSNTDSKDEGQQDDEAKKQAAGNGFAAVIFGDSDFLAQKDIIQGLNMDLALNSIASLAQESDIVSIRPKQPKGTKLNMTRSSQLGVVAAGVMLPVMLFLLGGVFFYRRRSA